MRISDWSSDVCSSDLRPLRRQHDLGGRDRDHPDHPVVSALRHDLPARLAREDLLLRARLRLPADPDRHLDAYRRSEEHTSELQSLMRISYAVFCLKKKKKNRTNA